MIPFSTRGVQSPPPSRWQAALGERLHAPSPRPGFEQVDWAYHQQIVDLLVVGLRGSGNDIIVEVDLRSNDGRTARADIMGGKCGFDIACIEVKTSLVYDDYEQFTGDAFRRQQAAVLAQIPPGGKVRSPNAKVVKIGLVPNIPFPPMRLEMVYAIPGQLMRFTTIAAAAPIPPGLPL